MEEREREGGNSSNISNRRSRLSYGAIQHSMTHTATVDRDLRYETDHIFGWIVQIHTPLAPPPPPPPTTNEAKGLKAEVSQRHSTAGTKHILATEIILNLGRDETSALLGQFQGSPLSLSLLSNSQRRITRTTMMTPTLMPMPMSMHLISSHLMISHLFSRSPS